MGSVAFGRGAGGGGGCWYARVVVAAIASSSSSGSRNNGPRPPAAMIEMERNLCVGLTFGVGWHQFGVVAG